MALTSCKEPGKFILCLGCWVSSWNQFSAGNGVYPSGNKLLEQWAVTFQCKSLLFGSEIILVLILSGIYLEIQHKCIWSTLGSSQGSWGPGKIIMCFFLTFLSSSPSACHVLIQEKESQRQPWKVVPKAQYVWSSGKYVHSSILSSPYQWRSESDLDWSCVYRLLRFCWHLLASALDKLDQLSQL